MKIKITLFISIIFSISVFAQEDNYILLKEKSKTKIIYDRVFGISNATSIKKEDVSTNYFYQVYHEIQRADFLDRLPKLEKLKENANKGFAQKVIPLSILISDFEKISQCYSLIGIISYEWITNKFSSWLVKYRAGISLTFNSNN